MKRYPVAATLALVACLMFWGKLVAQPDSAVMREILRKTVAHPHVFGATLACSLGDSVIEMSEGNLSRETAYFIASTNKLYTTALVLRHVHRGLIRLDDPIGAYLDEATLNGLHTYKGRDYSPEITVRQLLAHSSGLPDYFQGKNAQGKTLLAALQRGEDTPWSFDEAIALAKSIKPRFRPCHKQKAHYADTNYQLLGRLVENLSGKPFPELLQAEILEPLGLRNTYMYSDPADSLPALFYYKNQLLHLPQAMASFQADGGVVSTATESIRFLTAFFGGELFPQALLESGYEWRKLWFPVQYGVGLMKIELPSYLTSGKKMPMLLGHSGLSGAFAFYQPETGLYLAGTVNQAGSPGLSYRMMIRAALAAQYPPRSRP